MKRSSVTGYYGVEPFRDQFRAYYEKGSHYLGIGRKNLGIFESAQEASEIVDDYRVKTKGILRSFEQLNNKTPERIKEYEMALAELETERQKLKEIKVEELKAIEIPQTRHSELISRFHSGESLSQLANAFGAHIDTVKATLRTIQEHRLTELGITIVHEQVTPSPVKKSKWNLK